MPWEKKFNPNDVIRLAMETFWARGYDATSMQDLVDVTGVNRASLYATYGDKRDLFLASLKNYDEAVRQRLMSELSARFPPDEAIRRLFLAFADQLQEPGRNWGCFLTNTALELAPHDRDIGSVVASAQMDLELFFKEQIKSGQESGEFSPSLNVEQAAQGVLASMLGFLVLVRSRPDQKLLKSIVDGVIAALK